MDNVRINKILLEVKTCRKDLRKSKVEQLLKRAQSHPERHTQVKGKFEGAKLDLVPTIPEYESDLEPVMPEYKSNMQPAILKPKTDSKPESKSYLQLGLEVHLEGELKISNVDSETESKFESEAVFDSMPLAEFELEPEAELDPMLLLSELVTCIQQITDNSAFRARSRA